MKSTFKKVLTNIIKNKSRKTARKNPLSSCVGVYGLVCLKNQLSHPLINIRYLELLLRTRPKFLSSSIHLIYVGFQGHYVSSQNPIVRNAKRRSAK